MIFYYSDILEGKNDTVTKSLFYPKQIRVSPFFVNQNNKKWKFQFKNTSLFIAFSEVFVVVLV